MEQDYVKAVEWYKKAIEQGEASAQYDIGDCYYNGNGVEQDYVKAAEWYRKAAENGSCMAKQALENLEEQID